MFLLEGNVGHGYKEGSGRRSRWRRKGSREGRRRGSPTFHVSAHAYDSFIRSFPKILKILTCKESSTLLIIPTSTYHLFSALV